MDETWVLNYALFCEGMDESAQVFELLADSHTISMMESYMETLFDTFISIDGDAGVSFSIQSVLSSSRETEENLIGYYIPLGNLALILVCCCVFAYHRYRTKRWQEIATKISSRDVQMCSIPTFSEGEDSISLNEVASLGYTSENQG